MRCTVLRVSVWIIRGHCTSASSLGFWPFRRIVYWEGQDIIVRTSRVVKVSVMLFEVCESTF